ncbi:alpha/beta hydrolase [Pelagibacterium sp. 26DY04]|uniref:alpha/beta hydrolase n=2 Tax=unclassified Pelagibacterium TaxID=2623280 RepID=UPI002816921F|nr:alpha/beta hydrolase [Pelagibacterium sp. 26DY04]WMT86571.1 alpha/beta hydrolase [Pelagibacterium sp. 26DY04]
MDISRRSFLGSMSAFALGAGLLPSQAQAVSLMDPFNLPTAVDGGVVKIGDGIAYAGGPRGKLDVYVKQNPSANAPVVMFIYGGGWNRGERWEYDFVGRALASRGFVTVIPDYRLVPEVTYPAFLYDVAVAAKWVEDNITTFGGNPDKLFMAGHSAGAYNAVMMGLDPSFFRDAGCGLKVRGVAGLAGPYDFYPFEFNEVRAAFGYAPNPEGTQPVRLVTSDAPPMFLATGNLDLIVKTDNTTALAAKLREHNVPVDERYYDGIGHMEIVTALGAMLRWRAPVLDDMVNFYASLGALDA